MYGLEALRCVRAVAEVVLRLFWSSVVVLLGMLQTYSSDSARGSDGAGGLGRLSKGVSEHCDRLLCLYTQKKINCSSN